MTDYINNRFIQQTTKWLKAAPWFKGQVVGKAGIFPTPKISNKTKYIQFDKLYARGAKIKVSDEKEFPQAVKSEMRSLLRKVKWFNGIMDWTEEEYDDYQAGESFAVEDTRVKIDNENFAYDETLEDWFVGYGIDFTAKEDYDERWIPWMKLQSSATSDASNPADMNDKVTNIAGTTGTTAVELNMTTIATSLSTGMTIDFVGKTFRPIIRAMNLFKDAYTGRRMNMPNADGSSKARFQCHMAPEAVDEMFNLPIYDGEKILSTTIGEAMNKIGIELVPNRLFSAAFAEEAGGGEGKIQFGFCANFSRNFQMGVPKKMNWEADKKIPGVKDKWIKRMTSRLAPFTMPYFDGTTWYKSFFAGYFLYMNDT